MTYVCCHPLIHFLYKLRTQIVFELSFSHTLKYWASFVTWSHHVSLSRGQTCTVAPKCIWVHEYLFACTGINTNRRGMAPISLMSIHPVYSGINTHERNGCHALSISDYSSVSKCSLAQVQCCPWAVLYVHANLIIQISVILVLILITR